MTAAASERRACRCGRPPLARYLGVGPSLCGPCYRAAHNAGRRARLAPRGLRVGRPLARTSAAELVGRWLMPRDDAGRPAATGHPARRCAWCNRPGATRRDREGDPICDACAGLPGPDGPDGPEDPA